LLKTTDDNKSEEAISKPLEITTNDRKQSNVSACSAKNKKAFVFKQINLKAKGLLFIKMDESWASKVCPFEIMQKI